jgi:hypothetical protein
MSETRKIAAILVSDVVGYSRLAGADEDRILARLRTLRSDLIDPDFRPDVIAHQVTDLPDQIGKLAEFPAAIA